MGMKAAKREPEQVSDHRRKLRRYSRDAAESEDDVAMPSGLQDSDGEDGDAAMGTGDARMGASQGGGPSNQVLPQVVTKGRRLRAMGPPNGRPQHSRRSRHEDAENGDGSDYERLDAENGREENVPATPTQGEAGEGGLRRDSQLQEHGRVARPRAMPAAGDDGYQLGGILRITVRNFMTHSLIMAHPSPRLNLIIGPNGSGKSSIVCAICLGLGGEPKVLGRASNVRDFVQRGKEKAGVSIVLRGERPGDAVEVTRVMSLDNRSEWSLNGRSCTREAVRELMQKFNIQVGNLTQFLPQDRVCAFAGLTPVDLLTETEKAVGDVELPRQHQALIQKQSNLSSLEIEVNSLATNIETLKKNNAEVERDVERVQKRNAILQEVERMKRKVPWLKYEMRENECQQLQESLRETFAARDAARRELETARRPLQDLKDRKERFLRLLSKMRKENEDREKLLKSADAKEQERRDCLLSLQRSETEERQKAATRQQRLQRAMADLQQAQVALQDLPEPEHPKEQLEPINQREREAREKSLQFDSELRACQHESNALAGQLQRVTDRIAFVSDSRNRRIQRMGNRDVEKACDWVDRNRANFKAPVYGPLVAEVNVINLEHACFLEQHVPGYLWRSFVATCPEDRDMLVHHLKAYGIPVVMDASPPDQLGPPPHAMAVTSQLRELGVTHRLDEVFNAAPVVRAVLNNQASLYQSFVGTARADEQAERIQACGVSDLWTPDSHYRWTRSRFSSATSAMMHGVRKARLFVEESSLQEEQDLHRRRSQLQAQQQSLQQRETELRRSKREHENQQAKAEHERAAVVTAFKQAKKRKADQEELIRRRHAAVTNLSAIDDVEAVIQRLHADMDRVKQQRLAAFQEMTRVLLKLSGESMRMAALKLAVEEISTAMHTQEAEVKELDKRLLRLQQEVQRDEQQLQDARSAAEEAKQEAVATVDLEADEEMRELFEDLPDTLEELHAAVRERKSYADRMICPNPHVLEQYEQRTAEIARLETKLEEGKVRMVETEGELQQLKDLWLPRLRTLVARINETFGRNFKEMAVAGEVLLDERGSNYEAYGIRIRVKFRATAELQDLSANRQSGGERSVATILYLVSLQDLTRCPFRVVDEINQGMDPVNERNMFQQLVKAASQPTTPQCFLITPKLLKDLDYGTCCSVHCIMNGQHVDTVNGIPGFKDGSSLSQALF